jgi:hypothetical protein
MRIKALALTAALAVAGIATSHAQVYSQNAVGYVNVTFPAGLTIVANPLNGTNNEMNTVILLPAGLTGASLYRYDPGTGGFKIYTYAGPGAGWFGAPGDPTTLDPGEGVFVQNISGVAMPFTFVGEVAQGALSNPLVGPGQLQLVSSQVPQSLALGSAGAVGTLEFAAQDADNVYTWDDGTQNYLGPWTYFAGTWFGPGMPAGGPGPVIPVGTGFWLQRTTGAASSWDRNFSVN